MHNNNYKKICFIVSDPMSVVAFLLPYIKSLSENNEISIIANTQDLEYLKSYGIDLNVIRIPIIRSINIWKDFEALLLVVHYLNKKKFTVVHSVTPKAGLIAMLAAWLVRAPVRVHTFTGQVWVTKTGLIRVLLKYLDKLIVYCSTNILVDSPSQREFLIKEKVITEKNSQVLANGSICGVDIHKFKADDQVKLAIRTELNIPQEAVVLLYLGRLNREKGVLDLANAFNKLAKKEKLLRLLIIGPDEENLYEEIQNICLSSVNQIVRLGYTKAPERYMASADIFCLPSYREGFGSSVIEAAACGVPAVASRIYGLTDAIQDSVTGLLHTPANIEDIVEKLSKLIDNKKLRDELGVNAKKYATDFFSQERFSKSIKDFYSKLA